MHLIPSSSRLASKNPMPPGALVLALVVIAYFAFTTWFQDSSLAHLSQEKVTIATPSGPLELYLRIAATPEAQQQGLMGVKELGEKEGMLFAFPSPKLAGFWMKNTPLPLDMIFVNAEGKIIQIVKNTVPYSEERILAIAPTQLVLEVNAGLTERYGIAVGQKVNYAGLP